MEPHEEVNGNSPDLRHLNGSIQEISCGYQQNENRRIIRNVLLISLAFVLLFTAASNMSNLQSSFYPQEGLGNWASATGYTSLIISSLFVPTILIRKLTVKWTLCLSMIGYTSSIIANFHPRFYTLLPAGVIVGFCAAPLWTAKCTYLTQAGNEYARLMSQDPEAVITRFFGIFFMGFQTYYIWGNVLVSAILSSNIGTSTENSTTINPDLCGANFCPGTDLSAGNSEENSTKVYILASIFILSALSAAAIIAIFLDSLKRYGETTREGTTVELVFATFKQMKVPYQILVMPLTIWTGLEQGFLVADFTAAFVTCGWGVENVGYVLISFGLANAIGCICNAPISRYVGRIGIFFFGAVLNTALIIGMLYWRPNPQEKIYYFVFAALWGIADSCWQCGLNSYYGCLFANNVEASFSAYRLYEGIGYVTTFVISNLICVNAKLYFLLTVLIVGMMGFSAIEICEWRRTRSKIHQKWDLRGHGKSRMRSRSQYGSSGKLKNSILTKRVEFPNDFKYFS